MKRALTAAAWLAASCSGAADGRTLTGDWGGEHVALSISAKSAALEMDCAHGTLDGALETDDHGAWAVRGRFVQEHGGPVRSDESTEGQPATYSGTLKGDETTLTITREGQDPIGPFTLRRGAPAKLFKCR